MASMIKLDGRTPDPVQESTENKEVANQTNCPPAGGPLREAAAFGTLLLLLRSTDGELRIKLLVGSQEFLVLGINGQRNGLLGLVEIHGERRK